jgi:L-fucose isomerase-like protein
LKNLLLSIVSSKLGIGVGRKYHEELLSDPFIRESLLGVITDENIENVPHSLIHVVLVATGGTEHLISKIAENSQFTYLLYLDKYNSLPATIEALAYLRSRGFRVRSKKYMGIDNLKQVVAKLNLVSEAYIRLRTGKFGVIGGVSPWLIYSKVTEDQIKAKSFGELIYIEVRELYEELKRVRGDFVLTRKILSDAEIVDLQNPEGTVSEAIRLYSALKNIIRRYGLSGLTIKCFDLIEEHDITACLALSLLNSELFPAACEGDIPLLYSMAIATWVTGRPVFMANPADVNNDEVVFAHCTSCLTGNYCLYTHFESGRGVGVRVHYPVGEKATVYRLDSNLSIARLGVGEITPHSWSPSMCRTQVKLKLKNAGKIVSESIGNHYVLVLGDHVEELQLISDILGIKVDYFY